MTGKAAAGSYVHPGRMNFGVIEMTKADDYRRGFKGVIGTKSATTPKASVRIADGDDRKGIQSVEYAFRILQVMQAAAGPLAIKDIAAALDEQPSKIHHYLVSLSRAGVVAQRQASERYVLGDVALQLGLAALTLLDPSEMAFEAAQAFREATGESTFVSVFGNRGPTIVRYMEGRRSLIVEVRTGFVLPLLTSATGHVYLSWLPEEQWLSVARLERPALKSAAAFQKEVRTAATIKATRANGVGSVIGGLLPRVSALSVPIFDRDGRVVMTLSALGWTEEFNADPKGALALELKKAGARISTSLGSRP